MEGRQGSGVGPGDSGVSGRCLWWPMGPVASAALSLRLAPAAAGGAGEHLRAEALFPVSQPRLKGPARHLVFGEEATRDAAGEAFAQPGS